MDPESGVILAQTAEGTAIALGLLKCGKIWFCPVCSAKIRHGRAEEITAAAVSWMQQGGSAYLVTFTARHAATDKLADLMDAIQGTRADKDKGTTRKPGAYQRLITGGTWAGRPDRLDADGNPDIGIRGRVGYVGMIRATEITVGQGNGWHPHIHALVLVGGRTEGDRKDKRVVEVFTPSDDALGELEDHFRAVWTRHLAKVDPSFKPSDEHGVDFKRLATARDAEDFGRYVAKLQDGHKSISPANEIARGDLKRGRQGNMTPFEMLGRIGDLMGGVLEEDAPGHGDLSWCLGKWAEYETAVSGRRAIEWTRYLRQLLGLVGGDTEDDDADLLFEIDGASEIRAGVQLQTNTWHKVTG
ncbi:replication protein, partial [Streptomyces sp. NPDC045431]